MSEASAPPRLQPSSPVELHSVRRRATAWLLLGILGLGAVILLFNHRPSGQYFFPRCTFHEGTGLLCPGCGGLRATHDLMHLRLGDAFRNNALLVLAIPASLLWIAAQRRSGRSLSPGVREVWLAFAVLTAFTIARNMPWPLAAWISP